MWCFERLRRRRLLSLLAALPIVSVSAACGFQPLYGGGSAAAAMRGRIAVAAIEGAAGLVLRERLVARLGGAAAPTHRLEVALAFEQQGVALTQENVTIRFEVVGVAVFRLLPAAGAQPVVTGEARALTGYSAPASSAASAYATLVAQRDAEARLARTLADDIIEELALGAAEWVQ
jgi:LPS-assembly lipoprotein